MTRIQKTFITVGMLLSIFVFTVSPLSPVLTQVEAQAGESNLICTIFPFIENIRLTSPLCGAGGSTAATTASTLASLAQFVLSLIFVGIIIIAIVTIVKAALKYIQSEGDEGKVEEATKAIKNVFIGIGALIVGLIGLVLIVGLLGASDALNTNTDELDLGDGQEVINELLGGN